MTNDGEDLVLEHLRAILGSLYALSASDRETVNALTRRVEPIEQRPQVAEHPR